MRADAGSSGGGPGLEPGMSGELHPDGESIFPRTAVSGETPTHSSVAFLTYWTPQLTRVIGNVEAVTGGNASSGLTAALIGIYEIDETTGGGQLVAATPDDATLFTTIRTRYQRALEAPVELVRGRRYAMTMRVLATTHPGLLCYSPIDNGHSLTLSVDRSSRRVAYIGLVGGELPQTFVEADLTLDMSAAWARLIYGRVFA